MKRRSFLTGLIAAPVVITTPGLLMPVRALEVPERHAGNIIPPQPRYPYSTDGGLTWRTPIGEKCHDPLCKRIARANKRPDKPVPVSAYLTVLSVLACAGFGFYVAARAIVEPKE